MVAKVEASHFTTTVRKSVMALADWSYLSKFLPLILKVSPMQRNDRGNVTSEASASRQSTHSRAMMLTTGSTTWPAPSGIMWASGGSSVSILSTIMVLISPMVWFSTLPSGAWRNRSASRSRSPSRMVYAMAWDVPVDRPNSTTLAA